MEGVSLDDLVYILTRLARQLDQDGAESVFKAAEGLSIALDTAQPLIEQVGGAQFWLASLARCSLEVIL